MKRKYSSLSLVGLLAFVALSITACPPPFFGGSSFHDNMTETAMYMPDGLNLFQKTIAPGFLSLSAVKDGVGENTTTIEIFCDLGFGQTGRRLSMWNHTTQEYQAIDSDVTWANAEIKQQLEFRPYVDPANVTMTWKAGTTDTYAPVLQIRISDALNTTANTVGQVWQITVKKMDFDDPTHNAFQTDIYNMPNDRIYYFREGSSSTTRPNFVSFQVNDNNPYEVVDEATDIPVNEKFLLTVNDDGPLGDLWAVLVDQGPDPDDTADNKYIPLPTIDHSVDGSNNHTYTLGLPINLQYSTTYHLVIAQAVGDSDILPFAGANMPLTQDLDGNSIDDTSYPPLLNRVELSTVLGGNPLGVWVLTRSFTTVAPPP